MKTSKATVEWIERPMLYITLEHEGMCVTVHADGIWPVLRPYQVRCESIFKYRLKDGNIIDIWDADPDKRDAQLTRLLTHYLPELWEVFGHRAQPFTPVEPWLPGILEQL